LKGLKFIYLSIDNEQCNLYNVIISKIIIQLFYDKRYLKRLQFEESYKYLLMSIEKSFVKKLFDITEINHGYYYIKV